MNAAPDELELEHAVTALLEWVNHGADTPIKAIHSCDVAEDGKTLVILCVMSDCSDTIISLCPGLPISIYRTDAPPKPAPVRHLFAVRTSAA